MILIIIFPFSIDREVILAEAGASDCSGSFDLEGIASWTECKSSGGYKLGGYGYHSWGYKIKPAADRPKGCFAQGGKMYWNSHPTGGTSSGSSYIYPVCKRGSFLYHY